MSSPRTLTVAVAMVATSAVAVGDDGLTLTKEVDLVSAPALAELHYTMTLANVSAGAVSGGLLEDDLPAELADCSWICTETGSANCDQPNGTGDIVHVTWLPLGSSVRYDISCTFAPPPGHPCAVNTATFSTMDPDTVTSDTATTCRSDLPIFADGFETGDTSGWSTARRRR